MDTILYNDTGVPIAAYGPRVNNGGHVEPPTFGKDPEFWGVYEREGDRWGHVIDVESRADASRVANLVVLADGNNYDPTDLAALAAGWAGKGEDYPSAALSVEDATFLCDVARLLHRLWLEIPDGEWPGVWAYEVAEPTGRALGAMHGNSMEAAEEIARSFISEAIHRDQQMSSP